MPCPYPPLELLGSRQLAGKDQGVKAGFVDGCNLLYPSGGCHFDHPFIFSIYMLTDGLCSVTVAKHLCYILAYKPRIIVDAYRPDFAELGVVILRFDLW